MWVLRPSARPHKAILRAKYRVRSICGVASPRMIRSCILRGRGRSGVTMPEVHVHHFGARLCDGARYPEIGVTLLSAVHAYHQMKLGRILTCVECCAMIRAIDARRRARTLGLLSCASLVGLRSRLSGVDRQLTRLASKEQARQRSARKACRLRELGAPAEQCA